ncbi:hypothetical protein TGME49_201800 [Toxoplasma gondii ME49]|uniref:Thioredoxin domain-containing protein n=10 Tax=Toxoplasma gondii TaxID=5811 RepID=S7UVZ7_TOXGG|nr:hypothetical protein TGME49_201800 [Toxoplasma gondii ME49]6TMG_F Chain F, ATPTG4 [Toxoplasma gondii GT1]6TMG_f Chain f, ATPTG4 [Toxoplasma gondii GT1]6TMK_F Chain F, ATPTG4 [Toxoplasma gondii GT1]6TMK_f Chain f, ATPTG4 [Toxoplasma gondii GT1]6TML_F7 Chain F7, ATPTG4 [Toxoplasma gondii GT1]6TML_F8 Chain F8, ATPTG4 [Toxoplasma gondii GT1]6TML_F9 Chain F9, ATPTG4 [Toxoplasma gondii GT1]6TML_f7 Chain f7, ATPTG4 [Toxoplasma gondii GT1]6TML_f8 Chain f8, ATPTG4 [Toxoplasma gondii GT1]6TML_f9|eukprot:XP_002367476.1 hypothetical protein TGME49_201800 [Toxoplasma gondii ME49]
MALNRVPSRVLPFAVSGVYVHPRNACRLPAAAAVSSVPSSVSAFSSRTNFLSRSSSAVMSHPCAATARHFSFAIPPANAAALADPLPATPTPPPVFEAVSSASSGIASGTNALKNVEEVSTMERYEAAVYEESFKKPIVCLFFARFSLQSKVLLQPFLDFAASASNNATFFLIDCDRVPRAAYHARVENVPSLVVMKGDDAFRQTITDSVGVKTAGDLIQEARSALDQVLRLDQQEGGTKLQPGVSSYTHHIGVDNLNVYRKGWPVA